MKANTFIIGVQKAGTTSLYRYMSQHPEVYFSEVKEVTYFVDNEQFAKGLDWYHSFFNKHKQESVIATSYVHMLVDQDAPVRLKEYNPDAKIIICLREPLARANSAFHYAVKNGWESEGSSLREVFNHPADLSGIANIRFHDRNYFENGLYHKHISNWLKYFPREQLHLVRDVDLRHKTSEELKKVFDFLDIDSNASIDTSKEFNKAGKVISKDLQKLILNKESKLKLFLRRRLPKSLRVWILGNVVSRIEAMNRIDESNAEIEAKEIQQYFRDDLNKLKNEFGIEL